MNIGVIGAGMIGSTIGTLWARAGHRVRFAARDRAKVDAFVAALGSGASAGSVADTIAFGDVAFFAIPFGAWPAIAEEHADALAGRIVVDAGNPYRARDGAIVDAVAVMGRGSGVYLATLMPRARLVKAFNTVYYATLAKEAHRSGERVAIPLASSDREALAIVSELIVNAGFDPVALHGIERVAEFDPGTPAYNHPMTRAALRSALDHERVAP